MPLVTCQHCGEDCRPEFLKPLIASGGYACPKCGAKSQYSGGQENAVIEFVLAQIKVFAMVALIASAVLLFFFVVLGGFQSLSHWIISPN